MDDMYNEFEEFPEDEFYEEEPEYTPPPKPQKVKLYVVGRISAGRVKVGVYIANLFGVYESEQKALSDIQFCAGYYEPGTLFLVAPYSENRLWRKNSKIDFYTTDEEGFLIPYTISEEAKRFNPYIR